MGTHASEIEFQPVAENIGQNFVKWKKDLLLTPTYKFKQDFGNLFDVHTGIRFQEKVGSLTGDMQIGPYDPYRVDKDDVTIEARTLQVYLGSVVKALDPNSAIQSIWNEYVQNEDAKAVPFARFVAGYLMNKVSENLMLHVWDGVRNDSGTKTVDLCDGIETIIKKEIKAGTIATDQKNLHVIDAITEANAEDVITDFYRSADNKLLDQHTYLCLSRQEYWKFCDAYRANHGALPYNNEYDQKILPTSQGTCELKVCKGVADNFLKLVPAKNFVFGTNINGEENKMLFEANKESHFLVDLVMSMFAGYQVSRIEKEFCLIGMTSTDVTAAKGTTEAAAG